MRFGGQVKAPAPWPPRFIVSRASEVMVSPEVIFGSRRAFCSAHLNMASLWLPIPTLAPMIERNAGEVRPSSITTRHSPSIERPSPPWPSGMDRPKTPSARISSTISPGMASSSASLASSGCSRSATNRRTVSRR
jgi:hypothetical protein